MGMFYVCNSASHGSLVLILKGKHVVVVDNTVVVAFITPARLSPLRRCRGHHHNIILTVIRRVVIVVLVS
jgi:hypothetical protein